MKQHQILDVYLHIGSDAKLDKIISMLSQVIDLEVNEMALGQDILDAVAAEKTSVDSFIALVKQLIANNTIPADVGANILKAISGNKQELDDAIVANTPAAP